MRVEDTNQMPQLFARPFKDPDIGPISERYEQECLDRASLFGGLISFAEMVEEDENIPWPHSI